MLHNNNVSTMQLWHFTVISYRNSNITTNANKIISFNSAVLNIAS